MRYGRPCGPLPLGLKSAIYLQQACLYIAVFELLFSCLIFGISTGLVYSTMMNYKDLSGSPDDKYWKSFSFTWQAFCYIFFIFVSAYLFYAHCKRSRMACVVWVTGVIMLQLLSLGGLLISFSYLPAYSILILMTIVRAYFVWVILAYCDQIQQYPDGYPPIQIRPRRQKSAAPTTKSSIRYLGDG